MADDAADSGETRRSFFANKPVVRPREVFLRGICRSARGGAATPHQSEKALAFAAQGWGGTPNTAVALVRKSLTGNAANVPLSVAPVPRPIASRSLIVPILPAIPFHSDCVRIPRIEYRVPSASHGLESNNRPRRLPAKELATHPQWAVSDASVVENQGGMRNQKRWGNVPGVASFLGIPVQTLCLRVAWVSDGGVVRSFRSRAGCPVHGTQAGRLCYVRPGKMPGSWYTSGTLVLRTAGQDARLTVHKRDAYATARQDAGIMVHKRDACATARQDACHGGHREDLPHTSQGVLVKSCWAAYTPSASGVIAVRGLGKEDHD